MTGAAPDSTGGALRRLEARLRASLAEHPAERVLVGFSGGRDSTLLLLAASRVHSQVVALHVHHGLNPMADAWQDHCVRICRRLRIRCVCERVTVASGNQQMAARRARYAVFDARVGSGDVLLLAHHRTDQAETLLMRLFQGRGLHPMPTRRRLASGGLLLRPFLEVSASEMASAAEACGADWIEDPGNRDPRFDRSYLRHQLLPTIQRRWPGASAALAGTAAEGSQQAALLAHLLDSDTLNLGAFPEPLRVAALRHWSQRFGSARISRRALAEFVAQCAAGPGQQPELRLQQGALRLWRGAVHWQSPAPTLESSYALWPPTELALPHGTLDIQPAQADALTSDGWLQFRADGALTVRFRKGGERFRQRNATRSLKAVFQQAGLPPWLRPHWPLIFADGRLCAIPGIGAADAPGALPAWQARWRTICVRDSVLI